jgi:hypothetical protein
MPYGEVEGARRVQFCPKWEDTVPKNGGKGWAWPDERCYVEGDLYQGAWYYVPDEGLDTEEGPFIVDEADLEFVEDDPTN